MTSPFARFAAEMCFGKSGLTALNERRCPSCKQPIKETDFRNEISAREFRISGLCQACQDEIFGKD